MLRKIRCFASDIDWYVLRHVSAIRIAKQRIRRWNRYIRRCKAEYELGKLDEFPELEISMANDSIQDEKILIIEAKDKIRDGLRDIVWMKTEW
jgi:hypothetical protein